MYIGFYTVFLKEVKRGDLRYGKKNYDYQKGTLVFIAPGQVIIGDGSPEIYQPKAVSACKCFSIVSEKKILSNRLPLLQSRVLYQNRQ
jgi:hypothetical protein